MAPPRILITGGMGQIGSELIRTLRARFGHVNVVASDVRAPRGDLHGRYKPFRHCDVLMYERLEQIAVEEGVDWVVHNSALMSVTGEKNPQKALDININGVRNVLELARNLNLRVLAPSTIAVYGPDAPKDNTPVDAPLNPTTVYGITKVFLEHLGTYYSTRYGVDFRCLRYPGILSFETPPGGGTTDYAIHMMYAALRGEVYQCPLPPDEAIPMMDMQDCLHATTSLLEVDASVLNRRVYNVAAWSFTPAQLADEIRKHVPDFRVEYSINPVMQAIAASWPNSLDDHDSKDDWGWAPKVSFEEHVTIMMRELGKKVKAERTDGSTQQ